MPKRILQGVVVSDKNGDSGAPVTTTVIHAPSKNFITVSDMRMKPVSTRPKAVAVKA